VVLLVFLIAAGLVFGVSVLVRRAWKQSLEAAQRLKLSGGYLLGALLGSVAFGIRFIPVIPRTYFFWVGAFALLLPLVFIVYKVRSVRQEELFP
jgi:hypothetical protein